MKYLFILLILSFCQITYAKSDTLTQEQRFDQIYFETATTIAGRDPKKALEVSDSLYKHATSELQKVKALMLTATLLQQEGEINQSIIKALEADKLATKNSLSDWEARISGFLSTRYRDLGLYKQGEVYLKKGRIDFRRTVMKVYTLWTQMSQELNQTQSAAFWQEYFAVEADIYEKLLKKKDPKIAGTLEELAQEYGVENPIFVGFLDGINESIEPALELEELEETSPIDVKVDYEKLFYNMMEAKADWLYNLPIWEEILESDKRSELRRTYLAAHTRSVTKIGRNDPCPCGSGKKYKYCCMNKE